MKFNKEILKDLVFFSLKSRFKDTIGGFVWVILNPIITYLIHCFLLVKILNLKIPNIFVFLLGGILPWSFFSSSVELSIGQLINLKNAIYSFQLKPIHIILATVTENFLLFLITFILMIISLILFNHIELNLMFFILPLYLINFFLITYYISSSLSVLNVIFRDVKFLTSFSLNILFFMTPLIYPESFFPNNLKFLILFNPIYQSLAPIRTILTNENLFFSPFQLLAPFISTFITYLIFKLIYKNFRNQLFKRL